MFFTGGSSPSPSSPTFQLARSVLLSQTNEISPLLDGKYVSSNGFKAPYQSTDEILAARGGILMSSVNFRYRPDLPLVLQDISVHIVGGTKVNPNLANPQR